MLHNGPLAAPTFLFCFVCFPTALSPFLIRSESRCSCLTPAPLPYRLFACLSPLFLLLTPLLMFLAVRPPLPVPFAPVTHFVGVFFPNPVSETPCRIPALPPARPRRVFYEPQS